MLGRCSVFVMRDSASAALSLVEVEGHPLHRLPVAEDDAMADAASSVAALHDIVCTRVVVDHYQLAASWHARVRQSLGVPVAAIDDLADRDMDVDLLIDQNLAPDHRAKYGSHLPAKVRLLGGPRFALLGPAFASAPRAQARDPVGSIGVFLGGTDPGAHSAMVVEACRREADFHGPIEVVTTSANPAREALAQNFAQWPDTTLSVDLPDLATFFARHDLQIGAGGGASWERCCIGAPSLLLELAANQRAVIPELAALGAVASLTDAAALEPAVIGAAVRALVADFPLRRRLAQRAQALVDGHGALRVAAALCANQLTVRAASAEDSAMMFGWRNDPRTRAVSRQAQPIAEAEHTQWLAGTLARHDRLLLVGEIGPRALGVIRFDGRAPGEVEVSLYLDPQLLDLGLGRSLLAAGEAAAATRFGGAGQTIHVIATVLDGNTGSARLFRLAGYQNFGEVWRKPIAAHMPSFLEKSA